MNASGGILFCWCASVNATPAWLKSQFVSSKHLSQNQTNVLISWKVFHKKWMTIKDLLSTPFDVHLAKLWHCFDHLKLGCVIQWLAGVQSTRWCWNNGSLNWASRWWNRRDRFKCGSHLSGRQLIDVQNIIFNAKSTSHRYNDHWTMERTQIIAYWCWSRLLFTEDSSYGQHYYCRLFGVKKKPN